MDCQENTARLQRMKNTQSETKPIKLGKNLEQRSFGFKEYTDNFKPQKVKMTNKVLTEKSNCVVCRSSKSRILKQKKQQQKIIKCNTNRQFVLFKTNKTRK